MTVSLSLRWMNGAATKRDFVSPPTNTAARASFALFGSSHLGYMLTQVQREHQFCISSPIHFSGFAPTSQRRLDGGPALGCCLDPCSGQCGCVAIPPQLQILAGIAPSLSTGGLYAVAAQQRPAPVTLKLFLPRVAAFDCSLGGSPPGVPFLPPPRRDRRGLGQCVQTSCAGSGMAALRLSQPAGTVQPNQELAPFARRVRIQPVYVQPNSSPSVASALVPAWSHRSRRARSAACSAATGPLCSAATSGTAQPAVGARPRAVLAARDTRNAASRAGT